MIFFILDYGVSMTEVTAAIIKDDDKILICQRPKGKRFADMWEFPGGKTEPGETAEECVIRECYEELGITIKTDKLFCRYNKGRFAYKFFYLSHSLRCNLAKRASKFVLDYKRKTFGLYILSGRYGNCRDVKKRL